MRNKECDVSDGLCLRIHNAKVGHDSIDTNRKRVSCMSQHIANTPSLQAVTESIIFPPGDIYSDEPPWNLIYTANNLIYSFA